jgi:hypothetical protein
MSPISLGVEVADPYRLSRINNTAWMATSLIKVCGTLGRRDWLWNAGSSSGVCRNRCTARSLQHPNGSETSCLSLCHVNSAR